MDILALIGDSRFGGLLSIVGVSLAVASYFWRREKTLLLYAVEEVSIVSAHNEGRFKDELEIHFQGKPVPTVTSSQFWIWNGGNTLIRSSDIATTDRLMVILPTGSTILQFTIGKSSRPVNNSRLVLQDGALDHEAVLDFDFLEPDEGFLFELVHTADRNAAILRGTVLNSKESPVRTIYVSGDMKRDLVSLRRGAAFFLLFFGTFLILAAYFPQLREDPEWLTRINTPTVSSWAQFILGVLLIALVPLTLFYRTSKSRIPPSLDDMVP